MNIKYLDVKTHSGGMTRLTVVVDAPPTEFSETLKNINDGKVYTVSIKPYKKDKSRDQVSAIWAKIGEIAAALYSSKEEIYHELLLRYGPSKAMRVELKDLPDYENDYRIVEVKQIRDEDKTAFIIGYKGLSKMTSDEAHHFLEMILSECREMGLSTEVEK